MLPSLPPIDALSRMRRLAERLFHWRVAWMAMGILLAADALACDGAKRIRLQAPVEFTEEELAQFRAMPPLRAVAVGAPPMVWYDEEAQDFFGVGIDVWCFIAGELGLRYRIDPGKGVPVAEKIRSVQEGRADVFLSLSLIPERLERGLFTKPYYDSHYAVIAAKGRRLPIHSVADLARYRVGLIAGVSYQSLLAGVVPADQIITFERTVEEDGLFPALRDGRIDVAVFNRNIFIEKRYELELFDLEIIHVLFEHPRSYRFYFTRNPRNERIVEAFDRYLAVMDLSPAVAVHEDGERRFIERYVAQRSQRLLWQAGGTAAAVLALVFFLGWWRYRRLSRMLARSNQRILQQQNALQEAYQTLERQSRTDGLTGLANRRRFDHALASAHADHRRTARPLSLLLIDVDHFKRVNDRYGHAVGDDYLRAIAEVLKARVAGPGQLAARYGGEEFACLLPGTGAAEALRVAEGVRAAVEGLGLPNALATIPRLTVSIGVATLAGGEADTQQCLAHADAQLYAAKHAGRNCVRGTVLGP